ncbi:MAG: hypothetical protein OYL97_01215 [Candidatus Poribacteria bacterium]|nr:hypothetical protein [Candidatus Poribacteria bacterium]
MEVPINNTVHTGNLVFRKVGWEGIVVRTILHRRVRRLPRQLCWIKTPFRFHSVDIATASNETGEIRYQMAFLKMPFRFHSADVATASNETGEIRYQMAFLKMPFRFHSADVATASNETDEIRYQMAF